MSVNPEPDTGSTRNDLVDRLNLMEAMITEGRATTARYGWIFVLWGLVDLAGMALELENPGRIWNWPVVITSGMVLQAAGFAMQRRGGRCSSTSIRSRAMSAIWGMMGLTLVLYCFTAIFTHNTGGRGYLAAIFVIIGMANAISAIILRWGVQGAVAVFWWAGGLSFFFVPYTQRWFTAVFSLEMLFGMVFFGLYAMWLERRTPPPTVAVNA